MIIRGRKRSRKAHTDKSPCRAQILGCTSEAQQRRESDQREAGIDARVLTLPCHITTSTSTIGAERLVRRAGDRLEERVQPVKTDAFRWPILF